MSNIVRYLFSDFFHCFLSLESHGLSLYIVLCTLYCLSTMAILATRATLALLYFILCTYYFLQDSDNTTHTESAVMDGLRKGMLRYMSSH